MGISSGKRLQLMLLAGGCLVILEGGCFWWQYRQAVVVVENESGQMISDLKIEMREGVQVVGPLATGERRRLRVYPQGESDFKISFQTPDHKIITAPGSYIESRGGYRVVTQIGPGPAWAVSTETGFARGCVLGHLLSWIFQRPKP